MKKRYALLNGRKNGKKIKIRFQINQNVVLKRYEELWDYIKNNHPRIFKKFTVLEGDKNG